MLTPKKKTVLFTLLFAAVGLAPLSAAAHGGKKGPSANKGNNAYHAPAQERESYRDNRSYQHDHHAERDFRHGHRHRAEAFQRSYDNPYRAIKVGIRSGQLTRNEAYRLKRELRKVEALKDRAWRDGYISRKEQKRIRRAEEKLMRKIEKERFDRQRRY